MPFLTLFALCFLVFSLTLSTAPAPQPPRYEAPPLAQPAVEPNGPHTPLHLVWLRHGPGNVGAFWQEVGAIWWARLDLEGHLVVPAARLQTGTLGGVAATPEGFVLLRHFVHVWKGHRLPRGALEHYSVDGVRVREPRVVYSGPPRVGALRTSYDGRIALLLATPLEGGLTALELRRFAPGGAPASRPRWLGPFPSDTLRWDTSMRRDETLVVATTYAAAPSQRALFVQPVALDDSEPPAPSLVGTEEVPDSELVTVAIDAEYGVSWGLPAGVSVARRSRDGALGPLRRVTHAPLARYAMSLTDFGDYGLLLTWGPRGYLWHRLGPDGAPDREPGTLRSGVTLSAPMGPYSGLLLERPNTPQSDCAVWSVLLSLDGVSDTERRCIARPPERSADASERGGEER